MQRLRAAQHRGERLERGADDVVQRLGLGQGGRRGLAVEAQPHRLGLRRAEALLHDPGVDAPGRAELGDLLEEVGLGHEVEGEPRRELVHGHARAGTSST